MGIRNSKMKLRRRRPRHDQRLNPEGSPSAEPDLPVKVNECNEACPCNQSHHNEHKPHPGYEKQNSGGFKNSTQPDSMPGLRVNLPAELTNDNACSPRTDTLTQADKCTEWLLSIPRDTNDQSRNEKISQLIESIRDVVGSEMNECMQDRSAIRVRLSVTPEPRSRCRVKDDGSHETTTQSRRSNDDFATRSTSSRAHHYQQIPGMDGIEGLANREKPAANENNTYASRDHRQKTRDGTNQSRSRSRDHPVNSCCRRHCCHANRNKLKSDRFQSPYDRSFQEAMYLRLTELQRKTTRQRCRAENPDMADSDSDDNIVATKDASDSEYSGDDDNCVLSGKTEKQCSRMFEPLSTLSLKQHEKAENLPKIFNKSSVNSPTGTNSCFIPDHPCSSVAANNGTNLVTKPWDEPQQKLQSGKRKTLKKKRPSAGGSKPSHGYLRVDALSRGGLGAFPNIPKTDNKKETEKAGEPSLPSQKHEHFHYHYYYCKPDT